VADLRTAITEVVTGLGMCGDDEIDDALARRPDALVNVGDDDYDILQRAWKEGRHTDVFTAAFMNGRRFLEARDALRGRLPLLVEWKGAHRAPGDEVVPADLRVDHVYLVSCKYLSRIVVNASPHHLFERLLAGGQGRRGGDWFHEVAPSEYDALSHAVRAAVGPAEPRALGRALRAGWPDGAAPLYAALVERVATESARRWIAALHSSAEPMLWRLLRIGSAPYFVLGASSSGFVRLRIATPWDWRRHFELRGFEIGPRLATGQPIVDWTARVRGRDDFTEHVVRGHVEVRWSHGRLAGPPEAKVYLDTPHHEVPGYFALV
jgi:hypothetical protein